MRVSFISMNQQEETVKQFFPERGLPRWLLLLAVFAAALAVRVYNADAPPLDFYPVRQYRAALLARAFYYESSPQSVSEKVRDEALAAKPSPLEPPVTETIASFLYRLFGGENLILPRLMSITFWLIAGVFLYRLASEMISPDAGIAATAFFLFLPLGVAASRSFQPDPLMIMLFTASVYAVYRYYKLPSNYGLLAACVLSALAILVKPICVFPILSVFFAMRIPSGDIRKILFGRDLIIFLAACVVPSFLYYGYGIFIAGFLKSQADTSFLPQFLTKAYYWKGWYYMVSSAIGRWAVITALLGVLLARPGIQRHFLAGLWTGYVLFGIAFTYHVHNHLYYQLMLIPIAALSIGIPAAYVCRELAYNKGIRRLGVWALLLITVFWAVMGSLRLLDDSGFDAQVGAYEEIGEKVSHSPNTVIFDPHEGDRVMYYGRISGVIWPIKNEMDFSADDESFRVRGKELLQKIISESSPDYFIVTTVPQFEGQEDLVQALESEYPVLADSRTHGNVNTPPNSDNVRYVIPQVPGGESPDYIIYDLRKPKDDFEKTEEPE